MSVDSQDDRPRPRRRNGFLRKSGDFLERTSPHARNPPNPKPSTFQYHWLSHPTSPSLLFNPGSDPRNPLASSVLPRSSQSYIGRRYGPKAVAVSDELSQHKPTTCTANPGQASLPSPRSRDDLSIIFANNSHRRHRGRRSTLNAIGLGTSGFAKPPKDDLLKRATANVLARRTTSCAENLRHRNSVSAPTESASGIVFGRRSERKTLIIHPTEERTNLFGPAQPKIIAAAGTHFRGSDTVAERAGTTPQGDCLSFERIPNPAVPGSAAASPCDLSSERNTPVIQPTQTAVIQVTDTTGTKRFGLQGPGLRRVVVQYSESQGQDHSQSDWPAAAVGTSRKRRAEESELDLIVANTVDQAPPGQESPTTRQGSAHLDTDEQGVGSPMFPSRDHTNASQEGVASRTAWLIHIMTSVRGAVTKVSNSIAGYVYPRNYNVLEQHSRDQQTGNITTKRIKLEFDAEPGDSTVRQELRTTDPPSSSKTNLVWVDESTRVAHWHQVALLVQALKDISCRVQKGQLGNRAGSPSSRVDDERRLRRLHSLTAHLRTIQQTAFILENVYSHTFLTKLKETFKLPQSAMDYETNPDEHLAIATAKLFLDDLPNECASTLNEAGATSRIIKGVSADLGAILNQKPLPGLVQRAGFVGKVMKFFRGRDSFGLDVSDDPTSKLDLGMPGSFPDTQTTVEVPEEGAKHSKIESDLRELKKTSNPFTPVSKTDTYAFVREHLAEMATKQRCLYQDEPAEMTHEDLLFPKGTPSSILKKDKQSLVALKRLQKARGMKKVQFLPSTKQVSASPSLSPSRPTGFLAKIFGPRKDTVLGSPLRHAEEESYLSDTQTDGSPDSCRAEKSGQELGGESETDTISEDSDGEVTMAKCRPRLVRHLNESLNELEAKGFFHRAKSPAPPTSPPSPPTLAGLHISDDKEGELDDLSAALQLMLDEDEAQRRAEEARKEKEAEEERLRKTGGLRVPRRRLIESLPADWFHKVQNAVRANPDQVLTLTAESVPLRRHDFLKVVPETEWLNDEIVNGSLQWLDRYVNASVGATEVRSAKRICLAMSSFFYKRLEDVGVQNTERTLRRSGVSKANFHNLETILIPICKNNHWTLLVIRPQKRTVSHMDSLNPSGSPAHTRRALEWLQAFLGTNFNAEAWRVVRHEAPAQNNGYDCGVHTITNGMCLALGLNAIDAYSVDELPLQRLRIAGMLLNKGFSGEFDLAGL